MGLCCSVEPPAEFKLQEDEQATRIRVKQQAAVAKSPIVHLSVVFGNADEAKIPTFQTEVRAKETIGALRQRVARRLNIGSEEIELGFSGSEMQQPQMLGPLSDTLEKAAVPDGAKVLVKLLADRTWESVYAATEAAREEAAKVDIHWAANRGELDTIEKVVIHAPDRIDEQDSNQETPLRWAAGFGRVLAVTLLVDAKASVNVQNKWGNTPLHYAQKNMHTAVVAILRDAGAVDQPPRPAQADMAAAEGEGLDDVLLPGAVNQVMVTPRS